VTAIREARDTCGARGAGGAPGERDELPGHRARRRHVGLRQEHPELGPGQAGQQVGAPQPLAQCPGDGPRPRLVRAADREDHHRAGPVVAQRQGDLPIDGGRERLGGEESGQLVRGGHVD
jgi:hypothetical protein